MLVDVLVGRSIFYVVFFDFLELDGQQRAQNIVVKI